jgi:hypothetical protein
MVRPAQQGCFLLTLWGLTLSGAARGEENAPPVAASQPPATDEKPAQAAPPPAAVEEGRRETTPSAPPVTPPPKAAATPPPTVLSVVPAPPPTDAAVHIAANYSDAWLEGRSRVDGGPWRRLCQAPCDKTLRVEGLELRMTAPSMTPSNPFVIDPGPGTARLRVAGGSSTSRELGIIGLAGGLPVTFGGMTLFGLGSLEEEKDVRTAGIVTLAVGATAIVIALPLLLIGSTAVRNEKGSYIARAARGLWFF